MEMIFCRGQILTRRQLLDVTGADAITLKKWQNEGGLIPISSRKTTGTKTDLYLADEVIEAWQRMRKTK